MKLDLEFDDVKPEFHERVIALMKTVDDPRVGNLKIPIEMFKDGVQEAIIATIIAGGSARYYFSEPRACYVFVSLGERTREIPEPHKPRLRSRHTLGGDVIYGRSKP
ncbi:MAG: hypothetical protein NTW11_02010 [Candidatus Staskawiczbacteria bacterium]|nr:hypothetical protein [Candidatus Staskawiczbacteria bacterium]